MFVSVTGVVKRSLDVYRVNVGNFMRYVGVLFLMIILLGISFIIGLAIIVGVNITANQNPAGLLGMLSGSFIVFLVLWSVASTILCLWWQVAFMRTVARAVEGKEKISMGQELKHSWPLLGRTFGVSFLAGLIETVPFIIGVMGFPAIFFMNGAFSSGVPKFEGISVFFIVMLVYGFFHMIYFSIRLGFSTLAVTVDEQGIMASLRKSSQLVKGRWWAIFARIFVAVIALMIPYYILFFLGQIKGTAGTFFSLLAFVYYILCLIPLASLPSQVIYKSAKDFPLDGGKRE